MTIAFDEAGTFLSRKLLGYLLVDTLHSASSVSKYGFSLSQPSLRFSICSHLISISKMGLRNEKLLRFPPFAAFPLDIGIRHRMRNAETREAELWKSFSKIMEIEHLAMYGRSLWMAYVEIPEELKIPRFLCSILPPLFRCLHPKPTSDRSQPDCR